MIRNLKVLGLALVALLAMTALASSAASAAVFHSEIETTEVKGEQTTANVFEVPGAGKVECTTAKFTGTIVKTGGSAGNYTRADATIHPEYSGCKAFTFATAHVTTTGCNYVFSEITGASSPYNGKVTIECEGGKSISITPTTFGVSACTMTIGAHTPKTNNVDLKNESGGSSRDILVTSTVEGIAHSKACGGNGENDGKYTGSVTTKGFVTGGAQVGIWVE